MKPNELAAELKRLKTYYDRDVLLLAGTRQNQINESVFDNLDTIITALEGVDFSNNDAFLTVNILRSWDRAKIERFALHLLGDDFQNLQARYDELCGDLGKMSNAPADAIITELRAENEGLCAKVKALTPHGTCGCAYDHPSDVCYHHSPQLVAALAENERLLAENDTLRIKHALSPEPCLYCELPAADSHYFAEAHHAEHVLAIADKIADELKVVRSETMNLVAAYYKAARGVKS